MLLKHLRDELNDAKSAGWREEARLVGRNAIIVAAAAFCPLSIVMAVTVMVIWDTVGHIPPIMGNTAYLYPVSAIVGIAAAIYLHNQKQYTGAMLIALAPFLWIPVFFLAWIYWVLFL